MSSDARTLSRPPRRYLKARQSYGLSMLALVVIASTLSVVSAPGQTAAPGAARRGARSDLPKYLPDELLVRFRPGVSEPLARASHARVGGRTKRGFRSVEGLEVVKLPPGSHALPGVLGWSEADAEIRRIKSAVEAGR